MRRKMYWRLVVIIVILFTAGVFLLTQRNIDMEPDVVFEPPSPEVIQKIKDDIAERKAQGVDEQPPPGETSENRTPTTTQTKNALQGATEKQGATVRLGYFERIYKKYGVEPPPPGYAYRMSDPGVLKLDENGNPMLYKEGEPIFDVAIGTGFAPTYEQYQHYLHLIKVRDIERHAGNDAEADRLNAEIAQLKKEARGDIPVVTSTQSAPKHIIEATAEARSQRASELMRQAYTIFINYSIITGC